MAMKGSSSKFQIPNPQSYPWLMISHGKKSRVTSFYSILEHRYYTTKIPQLSSKYVHTSRDGWLVTTDSDTGECVLLNLVSMESIKLPSFFNSYPPVSNSSSVSTDKAMEWLNKYIKGECILSEPPTASSCILGFFSNKRSALIWRPGQESWVEYEYHEYKLHNFTVCNKKIYGIVFGSESSYLAICEIADEKFAVRRLGSMPWGLQPEVWKRFNYLVGSCNDIFFVQISTLGVTTNRIRYIDVYKFDETDSKWIRVKNIGDHVLFIGISSQAVPTNSRIKGNCIYFIKGRRDPSLYFYNMEENRVGVILPTDAILKRRSAAHFIMVQQP